MRISNIVILILFFLLSLKIGIAQNFERGFYFYLPPDDSAARKFLPQFPRNPVKHFVTINREGHFSVDGKRIRFFGVNLAAGGAFPTKSKAAFIAGRMRKMGINIVRFHHMDNPWSTASLFEWGADTRHLNPVTLDRFENLIYQLKQNGIYANINLHCSRTVKTADGIADADSLADYGKGVNLFDPDLIALQKEYAQQLLTHVNPYTGLALVDDPVMAMLEIVNENSLYRMWRDGVLKPFAEGGKLTIRHNRMLNELWNDFLTEKYGATAALRAAWSTGVDTVEAPNQIVDGEFESLSLEGSWELELHNTGNAIMTLVADAYEGSRCARITILQSSAESWHIQWKQPTLTIYADSSYVVRFFARSDVRREIGLAIQKDTSPWTYYAGKNFIITPEWREYHFAFRAPETCRENTRLAFNLGTQNGNFWFDKVSFGDNLEVGLMESETLENRSVKRMDYDNCLPFTDQRVGDMSSFYIELQNRFFDEMYTFLKAELGVRIPITGTNWNVGAGDLVTQSRLDYIDNHAYWDHPQFPNIPWSRTDWKINNTSMLTAEDGGTIASLFGGVPMVAKPYTVSEYNHPFPNRFQSEGILMASSYSGFHDIDGLMIFDYNGGSSDDWETDFIGSYFSIHRNTVLMALMPSCAKAFRDGYIRPAIEMQTVAYSPDDVLLAPKYDSGFWRGYFPVSEKIALERGLRIETFEAARDLSPVEDLLSFPITTDTDEIIWDSDLFTVNTPKFIGLSGWLQDYTNLEVGDLALLGSNSVATVSWISLENRPLKKSRTSLITLATRIQNQDMVWDGITTFHNNWGHPPTQVAPVIIYLELNIEADSIHVFALDSTGAENGIPMTIFPEANGRFRVLLDQTRLPTLWFGIEAFGESIQENGASSPPLARAFELKRIFPNPFNAQTTIEFFLPTSQEVSLVIFDLKGREVYFDCRLFGSGVHQIIWHGSDKHGRMVSSGIYFVKLSGPGKDLTAKCLFLQ